MRAYSRSGFTAYRCPEDMERLLEYLIRHGTLHVSGSVIEELYGTFSEQIYCAGWIELTEERLQEFSIWLEKIDI